MSTQEPLTMGSMLARVSTGATELFTRQSVGNGEERFFSVHMNWDYKPGRLKWHNCLPLEQAPWFGSRTVTRQPIFSLPTPRVTFRGPAKDIVDFYATGSHAFFVSTRLVEMFDRFDPGTLDRVPITIEARAGAKVPFFIAMPDRSIEAVDPECTNVLVKDENMGGQWFRSVQFPDGAVFRNAGLTSVNHFTDRDMSGWFWSRELIEAAKEAGIRGLRTISCATTTGFTVDRL